MFDNAALASGNPGFGAKLGGFITKTPSHPCIAFTSDSVSETSPVTSSTPCFARCAAFDLSRTTPLTFFPAASKACAVAPPTFPVIPRMVNITILSFCCFVLVCALVLGTVFERRQPPMMSVIHGRRLFDVVLDGGRTDLGLLGDHFASV